MKHAYPRPQLHRADWCSLNGSWRFAFDDDRERRESGRRSGSNTSTRRTWRNCDDALRRDVELAKAMGFNGVRKHQKIEDPRYLYWADVLGLLVWEEMPSAYRFTGRAIKRVVKEWTEAIERDYSHPCVIVWVPFNESWGVPELTSRRAQRDAVQALYHLTRTLDPTRPVIGNDGWESSATDIIGIHDYDTDPQHLRARYAGESSPEQLFDRRRPGGRILTLDGYPHRGQPIMLTEFGGVACRMAAETATGAEA